MKFLPLAAAVLLAPVVVQAAELPIPVFAAQNFYGEVAAAIGGDQIAVKSASIPAGADPHDFEPSPSVARAVADATIVVFNGAGYDHWMEHLLGSTEHPQRVVIAAASLIGVGEGDNPHVWYDPRTIRAVAEALATALTACNPDGAKEYQRRRQAFVATLVPIDDKVAAIKARFAGTPITATEPIFGYMADALGLTMTNKDFQTAIMNGTEPSAREVAGMIDDLDTRRVKALIYNSQVADPMTKQLVDAAKRANVPVVGVTETLPDGMSYADWMLGQLDALEKALAGPSS